jgi:hypothetical protein
LLPRQWPPRCIASRPALSFQLARSPSTPGTQPVSLNISLAPFRRTICSLIMTYLMIDSLCLGGESGWCQRTKPLAQWGRMAQRRTTRNSIRRTELFAFEFASRGGHITMVLAAEFCVPQSDPCAEPNPMGTPRSASLPYCPVQIGDQARVVTNRRNSSASLRRR